MLVSHLPQQTLSCVLPPSSSCYARTIDSAMDHDQQEQQNSYPSQRSLQYPPNSNIGTPPWLSESANTYYSSYQGLSADGYAGYPLASASAPPPSSSASMSSSMASHFAFQNQASYDPRHQQHPPQQHQLQHMSYEWPNSFGASQSCVYPTHQAQMGQAQLVPPPMGSNAHQSSSQTGPRRTLTDADRRRMCLYHEENPTKKQTEIGEIFGVERSTVSKVLRQKEKYLASDPVAADGSQSPIRRSKPRMPDLDRTLTKWVQNQQSRGLSLSDDLIRNQARMLRAASGTPNTKDMAEIESDGWLEKFKQKNNIGRRASSGGMSGQTTSPLMARQYPGATLSTPLSDSNLPSPPVAVPMAPCASHDSTQNAYIAHRASSQALSTPSLSSGLAPDAAGGNTSSTDSPVFSPGSTPLVLTGESHANYFITSHNDNRQRRHTLPNEFEANTSTAGAAYFPSPQTHSQMPPPPSPLHQSPFPPHTTAPGQSNYQFSGPTIADARLGLSTALAFLSRVDFEPQLIGGADIGALRRIYEQLSVPSGEIPGETVHQSEQERRLKSISEH